VLEPVDLCQIHHPAANATQEPPRRPDRAAREPCPRKWLAPRPSPTRPIFSRSPESPRPPPEHHDGSTNTPTAPAFGDGQSSKAQTAARIHDRTAATQRPSETGS